MQSDYAAFFKILDGYKKVLTRRVSCSNGACNNGCPLLDLAKKNEAKLGGKLQEGYSDKITREIYAEGITILDQDGTMIGKGKLEIVGNKRIDPSEKNRSYCLIEISKKGEEFFNPVLEEFRKLANL